MHCVASCSFKFLAIQMLSDSLDQLEQLTVTAVLCRVLLCGPTLQPPY